jgi:hypothetical protein
MEAAAQEKDGHIGDLRDQGIVPFRPEVTRAVRSVVVLSAVIWIVVAGSSVLTTWREHIGREEGLSTVPPLSSLILPILIVPGCLTVCAAFVITLVQTRFFFVLSLRQKPRAEEIHYRLLPLPWIVIPLFVNVSAGIVLVFTRWRDLWFHTGAPSFVGLCREIVIGEIGVMLIVFLVLAGLIWQRQRMYLAKVPLHPDEH